MNEASVCSEAQRWLAESITTLGLSGAFTGGDDGRRCRCPRHLRHRSLGCGDTAGYPYGRRVGRLTPQVRGLECCLQRVSGRASLDASTRRPMPAPSSHLPVDGPQPCRRVSVHLVATYPVRWNEFATLRDFLQNFFDAAGAQEFDRAVSISRENDSTLIEMTGNGFALDWLLHMGASTKTGGAPGSTAGYFGEGFKIAALCALRDFAWRVEMGSREWSAEVVLAPDKIDGTPVRILSYDVKGTNTRPTRTWLRLGHTSGAVHDMLCGAVRCSFCFTGNPLLGSLLYAQHGVSVWARSPVPLPRDLPYRLSGNHPGLLFLAHQARATLPVPFVVSMADDRDHDRDRPSLYDFQMVDAMARAANRVSPDVAMRLLESLRAHWGEQTPTKYRVGRWANVVSALVRRLSASHAASSQFLTAHPEVLVLAPIRRRSMPERNRRAAALAWARSHRASTTLVQSAFASLGFPTVEAACAAADGYPKPVPTSTELRRRLGLLERFVATEFLLLFEEVPAPAVDIMDATRAGWRGSAELFPAADQRWSLTGRRIRFRVPRIVMPLGELSSSNPHGALATYLHERCHIFGGDASAGFSAALTDACAQLAAIPHRLVELGHAWRSEAL